MGQRSRCVIGICNNDNRYPELHKKHSKLDGDGAVRAAILRDRKR